MLSCTTQSVESYSLVHKSGLRLGIGMLAEEKPALFALISIASPMLYQWEKGSPVPEEERCHKMEPYLGDLYSKTLESSVGGMSVTQRLKLLQTPTEFYLGLSQFSLKGLPILDFYSVDQLKWIMRARCFSWIKYKNDPNLNTLLTLFTEQDEKGVKANAYGRYNVA